jgi:DNA-directed RNA polymerase I, II, and III subunit RPABC1
MEDTEDYDPSIAVVFNFPNETISEEFIKRMIQAAPKIRRFFVVAPNNDRQKPNAALLDKKAQNFIQELGKKDRDEHEAIRIEIFRQEDLLFNVLKHDLVPEHRVLSEEQKNDILQK